MDMLKTDNGPMTYYAHNIFTKGGREVRDVVRNEMRFLLL